VHDRPPLDEAVAANRVITSRVIDGRRYPRFAGYMRSDDVKPTYRYDRTLRVVMWMDAFLSVEMVVVCVIASPIAAIVGVTASIRLVLGIATLVCALLLAAFGAITGIVLMLRMRAGVYFLPAELNLRPLPSGMRPKIISG